MRDGRLLTRETKRFASEKRGRSWWYVISTTCVLAALVTVAFLDLPWIVRIGACLLAGLVHVRLFVIYHDYLHGAILERSIIAKLFFHIYGLFVLAPPSIWKDTHDHHHRNNARRMGSDSVGTFPIMTTQSYRQAGFGARFIYALTRHPVTIALGYFTVFLYGFCIQPLLTNPKKHYDAAVSILLHFGIAALLALWSPAAMLVAFILPIALAAGLGSYLFYAQHNYPSAKIRPGKDWDYVFAALRSSSFLDTNPLMHWFTANIGYHHVHHLNARIPFYRLPEAMAEIEELRSPGTTTLRPGDIIRCLRLKLWDPDRDRFVSFAESRRAAKPKRTPVEV